MKNKLIGLLLIISAFAYSQDQDQRVVTFEKVQSMIDGTPAGWIQKNPITAPDMKKGMNKLEVVNHIYIQNTATIIGTLDNQLIPYIDLLQPTGGIKPIYRTVEAFPAATQADIYGTSGYVPMLFNGFYDIPIVGDLIFDANDITYDPAPEYAGGSYQIYPGQDQKVNLLADNGAITWFGWVTDGTQMPTSLSATAVGVTFFTFNFQGATSLECPRYQIEWDPWPLGNDQGPREIVEIYQNTQTSPGIISIDYTNRQDATWWCTCLPTSSGNWTVWDKEASLIVDHPESYVWDGFNTGTPVGDGCEAGSSVQLYAAVDLDGTAPSGTLLYTDSDLLVPYSNPSGTSWFNTGGTTGSFRVIIAGDRTSGTMTQCP